MSRFLVLFVFALVAGCSGGGGASAPTPNGTTTSTTTTSTTTTSTSCVAEHTPITDASGSHAVAWTKTFCGPGATGETVYIEPGTVSDSGVALGTTRNINRGRVTWEFTNLDYTDLKWPDNGNDILFMAFMAQNGADDAEVNWHILGNRNYDSTGPIETRLVTQRFDGTCIPETVRYCEKKYLDIDRPYVYLRASKYKWDCFWNTSIDSGLTDWGTLPAGSHDGQIYCDLYDMNSGTPVHLNTYYLPTSGPYNKLRFFEAGGNTIADFRPNADDVVPMILSKFRFSVME